MNRLAKTVDSYRFVNGVTKRLVKSWIKLESPRKTPWTPLTKQLSECTVSLISTGGIALKTDTPFDQEGELQNPWWGDPSYRVIPRTATEKDIRVYHMHINPEFAECDLNCLLPMQRLSELVEAGELGSVAPSHYSFMGYILEPQELITKSVPSIIDHLHNEQVDVVILAPA